jgi:hypothetical protein
MTLLTHQKILSLDTSNNVKKIIIPRTYAFIVLIYTYGLIFNVIFLS